MNIVDTLKQSIGPDALGQLGGLIGSDSDATRKATGAAIPALLAGLAHLGSTREGAQRLNDAVDAADENVATQLSGGQAGSIVDHGREILGQLLGGGGLSSLGSILSKFTGMGGGTTLGLLGGLAPLLLAGLKRIKSTTGLDAGGLAGMLAGQRQNIAAAMPQGLGSMLSALPGLGDITGGAKSAVEGARNFAGDTGRAGMRAVEDTADAAGRGAGAALRWAIPVLAILLLGIWLVPKMFNRTPTAVDTDRQAVSPAKPAELPDARTASGVLPASVDAVKGQVTKLLGSTTDALAEVKDAASADAAIPKLQDLSGKLDGLTASVNALPADTKKSVTSAIGAGLTHLKELAEKAMAIPGVGEKLRPVLDPMLAKLQALSGQ